MPTSTAPVTHRRDRAELGELRGAAESVAGSAGTIPPHLGGEASAGLDARAVSDWVLRLATLRRDVTDAERIDQLRALEELKAAAAAAQARIAADLDASVRAAHAAAGLPVEQQGRGVAGQVALARRESPYRVAGTWGWRRC